LARENRAYESVASKFWEHFIHIAYAMNHLGSKKLGLWDDADGFYYDALHLPDGESFPMKVRSMVGLIPLFAVETLEPELLERLPGFKRRLEWFIDNRRDLTANVACMRTEGMAERRLLSIVDRDKLRRVLALMLDEREFLSPYGIRALSRFHHDNPYMLGANGSSYRVAYEPAESSTGLFGGNSNWRGPIWFSRELPHYRVAAEVSPLPGGRLQGGIPYRVRPHADLVGGRGRTLPPLDAHLPARTRRTPARVRRHGEISDRSPLEGFGSVS
jgi:hypothetical protein